MTVSDTLLQSLIYVAVHTQERAHGDRPWDEAGVHAEVRRLRDEGLSGREIAQRTLGHAWNPKSRTPGAIRFPLSSPPTATGPVNPERFDECPLHVGQPAVGCRSCASEVLADPSWRPGHPKSKRTKTQVQEERQALIDQAREHIHAAQHARTTTQETT